jgi:hypothetical protein
MESCSNQKKCIGPLASVSLWVGKKKSKEMYPANRVCVSYQWKVKPVRPKDSSHNNLEHLGHQAC